MFDRPRKTSVLVAALVLVGSGLPLVLYGILFGRIPTVMPQAAKTLLHDPNSAAALVAVRPPQTFAAGHIEGAVNWPLEDIRRTSRPDQVPATLRGKTLLVLCDVGMASRLAVSHLSHMGIDRAINVRGGIQEWMRSAPQPEGRDWDRWRTPDRLGSFPFRSSPVVEQAIAVLSYFCIKPIYMFLSLVIVGLLWKSAAADLVALRWAMIWFFVGETACGVNYFVCQETSYFWDYLHAAGMLVCFGFLAYAILEAIDERILGLSDPQRRCAAVRLCGACIKSAPVPCGLERSFYLFIPALMAVTMMVPTADWHDNSYNTLIFGEPYNYGHLRVFQQFEIWYCSAAALVMFGLSLAILLWKRQPAVRPAMMAFAAGIGPLGFGMFRMLLGAAYDQNRVWFLFWEEATELLLCVGICCLLWIFRRGLFPGFDRWLRSVRVSLGLETKAMDGGKTESLKAG
jgi:rhodanese-related sulfurtransferase